MVGLKGRPFDLLREAAKWLDEGRDPLHESFLIEHNVTLDEAYDLAEHLAIGARLYLHEVQQLGLGGLHAQIAGDRIVRAMTAHKA